jgi:hypothetical protein
VTLPLFALTPHYDSGKKYYIFSTGNKETMFIVVVSRTGITAFIQKLSYVKEI